MITRRKAWDEIDNWLSGARAFLEATRKKASLAGVIREFQRPLICASSVCASTKTPQEIGADCMKEVVVLEVERLKRTQPILQTLHFAQCDGSMQRDDGIGRLLQ